MMTVYEARGIEQGMQQGMQQGMEQGMQQGMQKGEMKIARQDVLEVLQIKFNKIPYHVKEKINYCDDLNILKRLLHQSVLLNSIDDLKLP